MGKILAVADAGNTRIKCGIFDNQRLISVSEFYHWDQHLVDFIRTSGAHNLLVSSVVQIPEHFMSHPDFTVKLFDPQLHLPIENHYATPQTLGSDRLANACGAWMQNQQKGPVLSIDMGTCIKYDIVNNRGHYLGGGISPGLQMRFKALNHFTQKLPLVEAKAIPPLVGNTSETAISSGVVNGIRAEINGLVGEYEQQFPGLKVFLTGGDAAFFSGSLKNNIFAIPFLTLHGLNAIAQLNGTEE